MATGESKSPRWMRAIAAIGLLAATATATAADAAPDKLPHKAGKPVAVAIYEFRSSIYEVPARGATDMFVTALIEDHTFRVVERSQLTPGVVAEKQLNSQGLTDGEVARKPLRGAQYIFEGTISEANVSASQGGSSVGVAGMSVSSGKNRDVIAIDVRIIDAASGEVVDGITLRKAIKSKSKGVSGVGSLLGTVLAKQGKDTTYTPDVNVQQQHKEGLDEALRSLINDAVAQLAARF